MTERLLLEAVAAAPDDDRPRLIYADFLQERGDARGEFIALQCALAGAGLEPERRAELERRQDQLSQAHEQEWLVALGLRPGYKRFVRGFVEEVELEEVMTRTDRLEPLPLRALKVPYSRDPLPHVLSVLARHPALQRLVFQGAPQEIEALVASEQALQLRAFESRLLDASTVQALATAPALRHLTHLALPQSSLRARGARAIASSPHLARLTSLDLSRCELGSEGARALAESSSLCELATLDLSHNGISADGARALAHPAHLRAVTSLSLRGNPISAAARQRLRERFGAGLQL